MKIYCIKCGAPCEKGMRFCGRCGYPIELPAADNAAPKAGEDPPVQEGQPVRQNGMPQPKTGFYQNPDMTDKVHMPSSAQGGNPQNTQNSQNVQNAQNAQNIQNNKNVQNVQNTQNAQIPTFGGNDNRGTQNPPVQKQTPPAKPVKRDYDFDEDMPAVKKRSKAPIIIICSVLGVLLILGTLFLLHVLGMINIPFLEQMMSRRSDPAATEIAVTQPVTEYYAPTEAPTERPTQTPKVKVTDGINRKFEDVKKDMEGLGLKVKMVEQDSTSVAKGKVISQDIPPGTLVDSGTMITLYVSKGSTQNPDSYDQKLVVRNTSGSSATAELYEWENGSWVKKASYSAVVGDNGVGKAQEGSKRTPEGKFKLGVVLSEYDPGTKMQWYRASSSTVVVDDVNFPSLYNKIMDSSEVPYGCSADPTGRNLTNGTVNAMIYIDFNGDGFSEAKEIGGGSAIGLRGVYSMGSGTYGDVDISASDMNDLLSRLDPAKNPYIEIH